MSWDPGTYMKFGDARTRPAVELLSRVPVESPAKVTDLGCGPGNSTALLAARWPEASHTGVDNSPDMLTKARASGVEATWMEADIGAWAPDAPQDVIFSNAALHWLDGHDRILHSLMTHLAPGGSLAVQMPRNFAAPSHVLLRETATEWDDPRLADAIREDPVADPSAYHAILKPHAVQTDIWETTYLQVLTGPDAVFAWTSGTALVPLMEALGPEDGHAFAEAYKARLAAAYPQQADGTTLFPFTRIFMVAIKA